MSIDEQDFLHWLERQEPDQEYINAPCSCALFQYLTHIGELVDSVGVTYWFDTHNGRHFISQRVNGTVSPTPHTFGAAASRLRASLSGGGE